MFSLIDTVPTYQLGELTSSEENTWQIIQHFLGGDEDQAAEFSLL